MPRVLILNKYQNSSYSRFMLFAAVLWVVLCGAATVSAEDSVA